MAKGLARRGFDLDLQEGQYQEGILAGLLKERGALVEVKADFWARKTGRVFVELRQNGTPSGLMVTTAQWWAFRLDEDNWVLIGTEKLRRLVRQAARDKNLVDSIGDHDGYAGVFVPLEWLVK